MQKTIEALLIIGVLANLIKAGDLLLRPHQQKRLQEKCDWLALKLHYTRPLEWYIKNRIFRKTAWVLLGLIIGFICFSIWWQIPYEYYIEGWRSKPRQAEMVVSIHYQRILHFLFIILLPFCIIYFGLTTEPSIGDEDTKSLFSILAIIIKRNGRSTDSENGSFFLLETWVCRSKTLLQLIFRSYLLAVASALSIYLCITVSVKFWNLPYLGDISKVATVLAVFYLAIIYFIDRFGALLSLLLGIPAICIECSLVLVITLVMVFIEILLAFARSIVWRIAEYNKGAFAGVVIVATALLAAAEAYLKYVK